VVRWATFHHNVPNRSKLVMLVIDMINDFDFPQGEALRAQALPAAQKIVALRHRARRLSIPVIYVNDNFGKWQSDFRKRVQRCIDDHTQCAQIAALLRPGDEDYFVLKPKRSGFFYTSLETLLHYLGDRGLK